MRLLPWSYRSLALLFLLPLLLLVMGFGYGERVEKTSDLPTPLLFVLGVFASGFVLALNVSAGSVDVAYAGVAGADCILDGISPYGHMPGAIETGDTYGPLNYLLYVPFIWLFGWSGQWDALPAAPAKQSSATPKKPIESGRSLEWETYGEADSSTCAGQ